MRKAAPGSAGTALPTDSQERQAPRMLAALYRFLQSRRDAIATPAKAASAPVWSTPFRALVPVIALAMVLRIFVLWAKDDLNRYFERLADVLEHALEQAVAFHQADVPKGAPSRPPVQPRAQSRPGGSTRPAGKPGVPATNRTRQRH